MTVDRKYDVVIAGSGLGGLLCAVLLSMRGMKVCVVEKNKQFGGNLQTFSRDKQIFDTGVHYIGGLDRGQTLYQIFKYAGLMTSLRLERMDTCFDRIMVGEDEHIYCYAQGYEAFEHKLRAFFPEEKEHIAAYFKRVKAVCDSFPLYNLRLDPEATYRGNNESAEAVIASFTQDKKLRAILAGNNILYAGQSDTTPFHVHALITNSYIESSWKCVGGGSQIARILVAQIRKHGGDIIRNMEVTAIEERLGKVTHIVTDSGERLLGTYFISNIHPATTMAITESSLVKNLYRKRISNLKQTISSFSLHLVLKKGVVPYENCNYYHHKEGYEWQLNHYTENNWPLGYGLYFTEDKMHPGFTATISILTPMRYEEVAEWANTYNRVGKESPRGAGYEAFKERKSRVLLDAVAKRFPGIVDSTASYYASTPLTNRDYIGDAAGSMYGIQKDYHDPLQTMISPRTKIPNLFLTGQNLNLHGILGTSLSAVLTCVMLLNDESLVNDIRNA